MTINNIEEFADYLETTPDDLERTLYKYTDCGAWIHWNEKQIEIGSIVEGSDAEFECVPLVFPFDSKNYEIEIEWLEEVTAREWHRANPQIDDIKEWIDVMYAFEEKPTEHYTIEDATTELEGHRECFADNDYIDLFIIDPEDYMEAMNQCIDEWRNEK